MQNDLDGNLQSLFHEHHQALPEEPFLGNMMKLLEKHQARRIWKQRLAWTPAFACCVLLSPLLVRGSVLLSSSFDSFFDATSQFIATPMGMLVAGLCILPVLILNRTLVLEYIRGG